LKIYIPRGSVTVETQLRCGGTFCITNFRFTVKKIENWSIFADGQERV